MIGLFPNGFEWLIAQNQLPTSHLFLRFQNLKSVLNIAKFHNVLYFNECKLKLMKIILYIYIYTHTYIMCVFSYSDPKHRKEIL